MELKFSPSQRRRHNLTNYTLKIAEFRPGHIVLMLFCTAILAMVMFFGYLVAAWGLAPRLNSWAATALAMALILMAAGIYLHTFVTAFRPRSEDFPQTIVDYGWDHAFVYWSTIFTVATMTTLVFNALSSYARMHLGVLVLMPGVAIGFGVSYMVFRMFTAHANTLRRFF